MSITVLGIDPSYCSGYAAISRTTDPSVGEVEPTATGMKRLFAIQRNFAAILKRHRPGLILIEGYAYGNRHTITKMVAVGTVIRMCCHDYTVRDRSAQWAEVPPTTLKKFVTGSGSADKLKVMKGVKDRWGFEGTDNEADAFGLAMFGLTALGESEGTLPASQKVVDDWLAKHPEIRLPIGNWRIEHRS